MKNRIKILIADKFGMREFSPTDAQLEKLGIERGRFIRVTNNINKLTGLESVAFAKWLGVEVEELFEKKRIAEAA